MFFSRDDELRTFKLLAEKGFGPALLATFQDGRVEEFLEGRVSSHLECGMLYANDETQQGKRLSSETRDNIHAALAYFL